MNEPLIKIKNLTLSYKNRPENHIIENLSCEIFEGDFLLVSGASGSGKSTMMNVLNGVIPYLKDANLSGEIYYKNELINELDVYGRSKIFGSVFQNPNEQIIFDKVEDEIVFPLENQNMNKEKMDNLLSHIISKIGLDKNKDTDKLSGGEKQKLIMGTTLAMGQKILMLDEPLANLSKTEAMKTMELLKTLNEKHGYTIIIIEHRLKLVQNYVKKVLDFENKTLKIENAESFFEERKKRESIEKILGENEYLKETDETVFELKNASFKASEKFILKDINFKVNVGDKIIISGDNGCGKTTLLNLLIGIKKLASGERYSKYNKKNIFKKVAVVLQNPDYQLFMPTVKDEVYLNGKDEEFSKYLLRHFELQQLKDSHPLSLSEGQKRKLGFVASLSMKPEVVVLDEPTVGLDDKSFVKLIESLRHYEKNILKTPLTLITVTHDERVGKLLGERGYYM